MLCKHFEPCFKYWCLLNTKKAGSSCRLAVLSQQNIKPRTGNSKTYTRPFKIFLPICANVPRLFYERLWIFQFRPPDLSSNACLKWLLFLAGAWDDTPARTSVSPPPYAQGRETLCGCGGIIPPAKPHSVFFRLPCIPVRQPRSLTSTAHTGSTAHPHPPAVVWLRDPSRASAGLPELTGLLLH